MVNSNSASHIPTVEMFRSGIGLVLIFSLLGLLLLCLTANLTWLRGVVDELGRILLSVFLFIIHLISGQKGEDTPLPEDIPLNLSENTSVGEEMAGETFWLWSLLEDIFLIAVAVVVVVAVVVMVVVGIVKLIRAIRDKMARSPVSELRTFDEEVIEVHEKMEISQESKPRFSNPFTRLAPAARIRELYRKKLLSSKALLVKGNNVAALGLYTARESAVKLDREKLASIYEKARYSEKECTSEDVRQMREACK